ncbi:MAG: hypothetical protein Q8O91_10110 [Candidatus Aminicenantes bacterium]|nr:hypothetical protein [Candidatus Aminicenantes bacterium]
MAFNHGRVRRKGPPGKPGALTRAVNTRLSTAETDPQTKPGAPAAAPAAVDRGHHWPFNGRSDG